MLRCYGFRHLYTAPAFLGADTRAAARRPPVSRGKRREFEDAARMPFTMLERCFLLPSIFSLSGQKHDVVSRRDGCADSLNAVFPFVTFSAYSAATIDTPDAMPVSFSRLCG